MRRYSWRRVRRGRQNGRNAASWKITESRKRIEYRRRIKTGNGGYKWVTIGVMQVLSAEGIQQARLQAELRDFDELHAQPSRELWDIMTGAAGASRRQPVWIVLTTAGDDPDRGALAGRSMIRLSRSATPGSCAAFRKKTVTRARSSR